MKFNDFASLKKLSSIGSILILLNVIPACSYEDCTDSPYLREMAFYNVDSVLLNGLVIRVYNQNSGFENPVDSFKVTKFTRNDDVYYLEYHGDLEKEIKDGYDYDVVIPKKGHFQITQINMVKQKCGNSIFNSDYNYSIHGYYVNDHYFNCPVLKVVGQ